MEQERPEQEAHVETVPFLGGGKIEVAPGQLPQVIATEKLNGCIAVVVACETADGTRTVGLTHFPSFMRERQEKTAAELTSPEMRTASKKKALIFFQRKRPEGAEELRQFFAGLLGPDAEVETQAYDSDTKQAESGSLSVLVPPAGEGGIEYRTWYSTGPIL